MFRPYPGIRQVAAHHQTLCCGREANTPTDDDAVEFVCPDCGRTWRTDECHHTNIDLIQDAREVTDGTAQLRGICQDCDEAVGVCIQITDARPVQ